MHEHPIPLKSIPCTHEFMYCEKCDVIYCDGCKSEWVKKPIFTVRDAFKEEEIKKLVPPPVQWPYPVGPNPTGKQVWCK